MMTLSSIFRTSIPNINFRYHYARNILEFGGFDVEGRLRPLHDLEKEIMKKANAPGATFLDQALLWLSAANEVFITYACCSRHKAMHCAWDTITAGAICHR